MAHRGNPAGARSRLAMGHSLNLHVKHLTMTRSPASFRPSPVTLDRVRAHEGCTRRPAAADGRSGSGSQEHATALNRYPYVKPFISCPLPSSACAGELGHSHRSQCGLSLGLSGSESFFSQPLGDPEWPSRLSTKTFAAVNELGSMMTLAGVNHTATIWDGKYAQTCSSSCAHISNRNVSLSALNSGQATM